MLKPRSNIRQQPSHQNILFMDLSLVLDCRHPRRRASGFGAITRVVDPGLQKLYATIWSDGITRATTGTGGTMVTTMLTTATANILISRMPTPVSGMNVPTLTAGEITGTTAARNGEQTMTMLQGTDSRVITMTMLTTASGQSVMTDMSAQPARTSATVHGMTTTYMLGWMPVTMGKVEIMTLQIVAVTIAAANAPPSGTFV